MPQLEEVIARSKVIYPALRAEWFAGSKSWRFPSGAVLKMRWLERPEDADEYQGHQYSWIGADELGTWPIPDGLDKIRATLRSAAGIPCVMRATANPGGPGSQWIKERYIDPAPPLTPFYDQEKRTWRVFIPSRVSDNRKLIEADPGYIDRLRSSGPPWLVRAWLDGDWNASAADAFFDESMWLVDGGPVEPPCPCDYVFATIDTAVKTGSGNDGTACVFFAYNRFLDSPLYIIDWDIAQIEGALLEDWLPSVFARLEQFAKELRARNGSIGAYIEDKYSGTILLQQASRRGWPVEAISGKLTALGKDERAMNVSGYHYQGLCKITRAAYEKTVTYKGNTRNHFLSQVCGFRIGVKDQPDDLLDSYSYGLAMSLGVGDEG